MQWTKSSGARAHCQTLPSPGGHQAWVYWAGPAPSPSNTLLGYIPSSLMGPNSLSEKWLTFQQVRYSINNLISIVLALPACRSSPKPVRANGTTDIDSSGLQNKLWFHQHFALIQTHAKPSLSSPRFLSKGKIHQ